MDLNELARSLMSGDLLAAQQWAADAKREQLDGGRLAFPGDLNSSELTVAAAITELLAERAGVAAPMWTRRVGGCAESVLLDPGLADMPRTLAQVRQHGPRALLSRNLLAGNDFLDVC